MRILFVPHSETLYCSFCGIELIVIFWHFPIYWSADLSLEQNVVFKNKVIHSSLLIYSVFALDTIHFYTSGFMNSTMITLSYNTFLPDWSHLKKYQQTSEFDTKLGYFHSFLKLSLSCRSGYPMLFSKRK